MDKNDYFWKAPDFGLEDAGTSVCLNRTWKLRVVEESRKLLLAECGTFSLYNM